MVSAALPCGRPFTVVLFDKEGRIQQEIVNHRVIDQNGFIESHSHRSFHPLMQGNQG